jgi:uncharacterized protein
LEDDTTLPERTCIVTREQKPEAELIRFVLSPEGQVVPDLKRKLPGRGCWVTRSRELVAEAVKRQAFARALEKSAKADPGLPDLIGTLIRKDLVQALSLCRKAGLAVSGFTKVEDALSKGHVRALIHVSTAGQDGAAKLNRKCGPNCAILDFFAPHELDLAFGRENVVHAAINEGGQARNLLDLVNSLAQYENLKIKGLN